MLLRNVAGTTNRGKAERSSCMQKGEQRKRSRFRSARWKMLMPVMLMMLVGT